jgi:hypothetical protein
LYYPSTPRSLAQPVRERFPRSGAPVFCCHRRCHPPTCVHRVLPARSAVVDCPPVLVETPSLPHLQSLNKLPDRQNLRRRPLRLSTQPADIPSPPNRHVYLDEPHHHDHVRDLTRPTRPRQVPTTCRPHHPTSSACTTASARRSARVRSVSSSRAPTC